MVLFLYAEKRESLQQGIDRRSVLVGGASIAGLATLPAATSAEDSNTDDYSLSREAPAIYTAEKTDKYDVMVTDDADRPSIGKFYNSGTHEGRLDIIELSPDVDVVASSGDVRLVSRQQKLDTPDSDTMINGDEEVDPTAVVEAVESVETAGDIGTMDTTVGEQEIGVQGASTVVEDSKDIERTIGSCDEDFCDDRTYQHFQTGFSVEFVDIVSELGLGAIGQAIGYLAEKYAKASKWARWIGGAASVIAGAILGISTGAKYTISPYDMDLDGWFRSGPRVRLGVGSGWDTDADDLRSIPHNPSSTHIAEFDRNCG